MKSAITTLEIALDTLVTNEPINRREGHVEQSDLEARNAAEIRQALHILNAVEQAREPIYPKPTV